MRACVLLCASKYVRACVLMFPGRNGSLDRLSSLLNDVGLSMPY